MSTNDMNTTTFYQTITHIKNVIKKLGLDVKAAMETLKISAADQLRYMTML